MLGISDVSILHELWPIKAWLKIMLRCSTWTCSALRAFWRRYAASLKFSSAGSYWRWSGAKSSLTTGTSSARTDLTEDNKSMLAALLCSSCLLELSEVPKGHRDTIQHSSLHLRAAKGILQCYRALYHYNCDSPKPWRSWSTLALTLSVANSLPRTEQDRKAPLASEWLLLIWLSAHRKLCIVVSP